MTDADSNTGGSSSGFPTYLFRIAWRDSRRSRRKLILFSMSIVLGVAAMVAIGSFGRNLSLAVEQQSKSLLGADLEVTSRQEFTEEHYDFLNSLGDMHSDQMLFSSMVYFPESEGTRLVQVRGMEGEFPYYGEVETKPAGGWERFQNGEGFLLEESLMIQFGAEVGDEVRIGELTRPIVGALMKVPGDNEFFANIAPRVFVPMSQLQDSGLLGEQSLVRYRRYYAFETDAQLQSAMDRLRDRRGDLQLRYDDVAERKEELGEAMTNLYRFLNLVGFVALLLGAIGIASAIQVHIQQRLDSVAVLRCLGATAQQAFLIFLIQGAAMGLIGVLTGTVLGIAIQQLLPRVFADVVPLEVDFSIQWLPVLVAAVIGFFISILFALLPLMRVRTITPLAVLRRDAVHSPQKDKWLVGLCLVIVSTVLIFSLTQSEDWEHGVGFTVGLIVALASLAAVAKLIVWGVRKLRLTRLPFVWRQGLASLYRPNNRTLLLMVSLGLGTFLILTLYLVQHALVSELLPEKRADQPNAILFDIQSDQIDGVLGILENQGLPLLNSAPVISMKIAEVKGRTVEEIMDDGDRRARRWALRRDYRSTYRDHLTESEELVAGEFVATSSLDAEAVPVSLEQDIAEDLNVEIGDEIVFDVQGIPVTTRVASLRRVDWQRVQANFFVVFPKGVLEEAPGFFIVTTRVADSEESARMQREVVQQYPNVSAIDLTLILRTVENILSKITFGIRFMALFTVFTGIILLITAVLNTRYQRLQESILLRTLGATSGDIIRIQAVEFVWLGILASLTGIVLAVAAQFMLTRHVFHIDFAVGWWGLLAAIVVNAGLTTVIGFLANRGFLKRPPLEILRAE